MQYSNLTILQKALYHIIYALWYVFAKMPACIHYFNSRWMSMLLFYVIRYRRRLVHKNIKDAYPHLTDRERWYIERRFYLHFCDVLVEAVMYFGFTEQQMRRHMRFINIEQINESARRGKTCAVYLGHYANWEWVSSIPLWLDADVIKTVQLYHPLENPVFDLIIGHTRQRFGGVNIPVNESLRHIVRYRREGKPLAIGFIADQVPHWNNIHHWMPFLNHPQTPVFTGPERLIRQLDMDVYYLDVRQQRRGYYTVEVHLITADQAQHPDHWITEQYNHMLEDTINTSPALWLWSHNRWKRTYDEWLSRKRS